MSNSLLLRSILLLGLSATTASIGYGQVVKTWTIDANTFKKKEGGKKEDGAAAGNDCASQVNAAVSAANYLFNLQSNVDGIGYDGGVGENRKHYIEEDLTALDAYLPELKAYPAKIEAMIPMSEKCQSKGQQYLTSETITNLRAHEGKMKTSAERALENLEEYAKRAIDEVGGEDDDLFVGKAKATGDPNEAERLVKIGRVATDLLERVLSYYPNVQSAESARIAALRKQYESILAKASTAKAAVFTSEYHKAHPGTVAVTSGVVTPGQEAGKIKAEWKPGEDFYVTVFAPNYLKEYTPNGDFTVSFMVGEREIAETEIWLKGGEDKLEQESFLSFFLFGNSPADNFDKTWARSDELKRMFSTMSMLNPARLEMRVLFNYKSTKIAEGKVAFNLSGETTGENNWFAKANKAMVDYKETERRNQMFGWCSFTNKLNDASLKAKTEAKVVELSQGKLKAVRVFFQDDRWTAVINSAGIPLMREIYYDFIAEDVNGNFYVGNDILEQDALLGGSFDTKQIKPVYGPLDDYTHELRDLWDHNNHGNTMFMLRVPKEKVAPYWK